MIHVAAKAPTCDEIGNIEYWYCADCGQAWLDELCHLNTNLKAVILPMVDHVYDNDYDADCNACGAIREVAAKEFSINFSGDSTSEEVSGLAFKFDLVASNIKVVEGTNIFESATIIIDGEECTLVGMGANLSNESEHNLHIEGKYLYDWSEDGLTFAVRVINIPEEYYDRAITAIAYYTYLDAEGNEITVDVFGATLSYNQAATN